MSTWGVAKQDPDDPEGLLLMGVDGAVFGFESKHDAEDFIDNVDEPGEWKVLPIDDYEGTIILVTE